MSNGWGWSRAVCCGLCVTGLVQRRAAAEDLLVCAFNSDQVAAFCGDDARFIQDLPESGGVLQGPQSITLGPDGLLYVCSEQNNRVLRYDPDDWSFLGPFVRNDPATPADETGGLSGPTAAVFGPDGNLYVASFNTHSVLRYDGQTGAFMDVFVASGAGGLNGPDSGMMFLPDGSLLVPSFFGNFVARFSGLDGTPLAPFIPTGVLVRPRMLLARPEVGDLLVSAEGSAAVRRFDLTTGAALGTFATLTGPAGLARDSAGNVYVSRVNGHNVRRYSAAGADLGVFIPMRNNGIDGPVYLYMSPTRRCQGDVDGDGLVELDDLLVTLAAWNACRGDAQHVERADLDNDGCVELDDLLELLAQFDG